MVARPYGNLQGTLSSCRDGGDATAKSKADSKAKEGAAVSVSGANSRAEDGGNALVSVWSVT